MCHIVQRTEDGGGGDFHEMLGGSIYRLSHLLHLYLYDQS